MKRLMMILALVAPMTMAAPAVVASQSTATSGTSHVLAVPAGAAGDFLVAVIAPDYNTLVPLSGPAGWAHRTQMMCSRYAAIYYKVSDGTETSLTVTSSSGVSAQAHVIRVSGLVSPYMVYGYGQKPYNAGSGTNAPDPNNISVPTYGDALYVAGTFYNGAAPTLHPSGYGFPLDAQNTVSLSMSFKFATGPSDNPGAFALPSTQKGCAFGFSLY